jgi:hypothetical protein
MSISTRRHAVGDISMAASSRSRFHSHFIWHWRIARSFAHAVGTLGADMKVAVEYESL